jgi:hypothetical protein
VWGSEGRGKRRRSARSASMSIGQRATVRALGKNPPVARQKWVLLQNQQIIPSLIDLSGRSHKQLPSPRRIAQIDAAPSVIVSGMPRALGVRNDSPSLADNGKAKETWRRKANGTHESAGLSKE